MTSDELERRINKMRDHLNYVFIKGGMTQKQYNQNVADLNHWADCQRAWRDLEERAANRLRHQHN